MNNYLYKEKREIMKDLKKKTYLITNYKKYIYINIFACFDITNEQKNNNKKEIRMKV